VGAAEVEVRLREARLERDRPLVERDRLPVVLLLVEAVAVLEGGFRPHHVAARAGHDDGHEGDEQGILNRVLIGRLPGKSLNTKRLGGIGL
jgi:hypothetical protein